MKSLKITSVILLISLSCSSLKANSIGSVDLDENNNVNETYADENTVYENEIVTGKESSEENPVTESNIESRFGASEKIYPELGNGFEGDIILTAEQKIRMGLQKGPQARTGIVNTRQHWPKNSNGQAIVPYIISNVYSATEKATIRRGMDKIQAISCVRFVPRSNQAGFVNIKPYGTGCRSIIGYTGKEQELSLDNFDRSRTCVNEGTVMHELIHALGYAHMHSHQDRDKFVRIYLNNVEQKHKSNFQKVNTKGFIEFDNFRTPYDYLSIMHYPKDAFAKPGKTLTIEPREKKYLDKIGAKTLSKGDIKRINNMYNCKV